MPVPKNLDYPSEYELCGELRINMFILPETLDPIFDTFLHITDPVFYCTFVDPSTWFSLEHNVFLQVKKNLLCFLSR